MKSQPSQPASQPTKFVFFSHNACRFGYPFFLSPNDDDAMLEIPNPTPSVHQTPGNYYYYYWFFGCVLTKKKKYDSAKFPSNIKTQRQVKSQHCTCSPKSPKFQEYQNNYPNLPNHSKIKENLGKTQKNTKKPKNCKKKCKKNI